MVHAVTRATSNRKEMSLLFSQTQLFVSGERKPLSDNISCCRFKQTSGQRCDHLRPPSHPNPFRTWCSLHRCAFVKKHSSALYLYLVLLSGCTLNLTNHFLYALATTSHLSPCRKMFVTAEAHTHSLGEIIELSRTTHTKRTLHGRGNDNTAPEQAQTASKNNASQHCSTWSVP